ncbi:GvpL/GvpF family gas vesicle protein [Desulfosporosinus sp. SYSU MS00001]|uniref:GvpL/GvpF family gas vesicle protein n=1 Tax=Desulfosporosinus sp. SYSU MS00001 TaxID=3416284 RepID=UPI003CEE2B5F
MTIHCNDLQTKLDELFERSLNKVSSEMEAELISIFRVYCQNKLQEMLLQAGIGHPLLSVRELGDTQQNVIAKEDSLERKPVQESSNPKKKEEAAEKEKLTKLREDEEDIKEDDVENFNPEVLWYGLAVVPSDISLGLIEGMENSNCHLVTHRQLSMVVCQVPQTEYGQDPLHKNLANLLWVEDRARKHEGILVNIMEFSNSLLPLPFCTMFSNSELIEGKLSSDYDFLMRELNYLGILREINLKLLVDHEKLSSRLIKQKPFQGSQGGKDYFYKKQWEQSLKTQMEQFLEDKSAVFIERLKVLAEDILMLEHSDTEQNGMITCFNSCFLVHPEKFISWEKEVSLFDQETDEWGFVLDISGPWPPFHFVKLKEGGFIESSSNNSQSDSP